MLLLLLLLSLLGSTWPKLRDHNNFSVATAEPVRCKHLRQAIATLRVWFHAPVEEQCNGHNSQLGIRGCTGNWDMDQRRSLGLSYPSPARFRLLTNTQAWHLSYLYEQLKCVRTMISRPRLSVVISDACYWVVPYLHGFASGISVLRLLLLSPFHLSCY